MTDTNLVEEDPLRRQTAIDWADYKESKFRSIFCEECGKLLGMSNSEEQKSKPPTIDVCMDCYNGS